MKYHPQHPPEALSLEKGHPSVAPAQDDLEGLEDRNPASSRPPNYLPSWDLEELFQTMALAAGTLGHRKKMSVMKRS